MTEFLNNKELYESLLVYFVDDDKYDIYNLMKDIKAELKEIFILAPKENRAVLVYQLIDVPLVQMPKMLNRMKKFYRKTTDDRLRTTDNSYNYLAER